MAVLDFDIFAEPTDGGGSIRVRLFDSGEKVVFDYASEMKIPNGGILLGSEIISIFEEHVNKAVNCYVVSIGIPREEFAIRPKSQSNQRNSSTTSSHQG